MARQGWSHEFDKRLASGEDKRWMPGKAWMKGEWQVKDKLGQFFRRNGNACCGCGHNRQVNNLAADHSKNPPSKGPRY